MSPWLPALAFCCLPSALVAAESPAALSLEQQVRAYIAELPARVGVAWVGVDGTPGGVSADAPYPLMSVFKLHQALYVLHELPKRGLTLNSPIPISPEELPPGTWSPLRDLYPNGGVELPLRTLLEYTLQQSDNNACDILFARFGGPAAVEHYIRSLGIREISLACTEADMRGNPARAQLNWSTPSACAALLHQLLTQRLLEPEAQEFLLRTLEGCTTGADRLAAPLQGFNIRLGHKTGTGWETPEGWQTAMNDVGFVRLPSGRFYTVAVLVAETRLSAEEAAAVIARISRMVYQAQERER